MSCSFLITLFGLDTNIAFDRQSRPIVEIIGERITNFNDFEAAIDRARNIVPIGGTCPGAMMERALGMIMANELLERPFKAAVLASDGVWNDSPPPETASKGFPAR